ncbi:MAG: H-NS histone family protein [Bradyrhizobium sp.]
MKRANIRSLSIDELWVLHQATVEALAEKIIAAKNRLDERLKLLAKNSVERTGRPAKPRRPYPPVLPKFRNPEKPSETWAGRGRQPRWVTRQLRSGKRMDDFRIKSAAA